MYYLLGMSQKLLLTSAVWDKRTKCNEQFLNESHVQWSKNQAISIKVNAFLREIAAEYNGSS